jgi:aspartyl-tRNA(Asn)/glutamyl-tRNA(Gln) amidotransferase subunit A
VAAGLAPIAIGTDAGGSSRRPPAHVGVVGFKPTQDLVPYGPGFAEPVDGISVICPITRTVDDARLAMSVLAGLSSTQFQAPRIGYAPSFGLDQVCDTEVIEAMDRLLERLRRADLEVTPVRIDWPMATTGADVMPLQFSGLAALYGAKWKATPERFDPDIGAQIEAGLALDADTLAGARDASLRMRDTLRGLLSQHDFLLCPTTPCPAWPVDRLGPEKIAGAPAAPRDHAAFTPQANHAGVPAITLPLPRPAGALPLGVQIIAGPNRDAALLAFARDLEALMAQDNSEETDD